MRKTKQLKRKINDENSIWEHEIEQLRSPRKKGGSALRDITNTLPTEAPAPTTPKTPSRAERRQSGRFRRMTEKGAGYSDDRKTKAQSSCAKKSKGFSGRLTHSKLIPYASPKTKELLRENKETKRHYKSPKATRVLSRTAMGSPVVIMTATPTKYVRTVKVKRSGHANVSLFQTAASAKVNKLDRRSHFQFLFTAAECKNVKKKIGRPSEHKLEVNTIISSKTPSYPKESQNKYFSYFSADRVLDAFFSELSVADQAGIFDQMMPQGAADLTASMTAQEKADFLLLIRPKDAKESPEKGFVKDDDLFWADLSQADKAIFGKVFASDEKNQFLDKLTVLNREVFLSLKAAKHKTLYLYSLNPDKRFHLEHSHLLARHHNGAGGKVGQAWPAPTAHNSMRIPVEGVIDKLVTKNGMSISYQDKAELHRSNKGEAVPFLAGEQVTLSDVNNPEAEFSVIFNVKNNVTPPAELRPMLYGMACDQFGVSKENENKGVVQPSSPEGTDAGVARRLPFGNRLASFGSPLSQQGREMSGFSSSERGDAPCFFDDLVGPKI